MRIGSRMYWPGRPLKTIANDSAAAYMLAGAEYDGRYLRTLSADAVPALIESLPALPVVERCAVATMLRKRWSGEREGGWRTWNLSDMRARRLVDDFSVPAGCSVVAARSA
jgi:hypothetical protein